MYFNVDYYIESKVDESRDEIYNHCVNWADAYLAKLEEEELERQRKAEEERKRQEEVARQNKASVSQGSDSLLGTFNVSAYSSQDAGCGSITSTGATVRYGIIAVDPRVIPYHTKVLIEFSDGHRETFVAADCGGAIKGNKLDIYMPTQADCFKFGRQQLKVYIT